MCQAARAARPTVTPLTGAAASSHKYLLLPSTATAVTGRSASSGPLMRMPAPTTSTAAGAAKLVQVVTVDSSTGLNTPPQ